MKNLCGQEDFVSVLYFFSENCGTCDDQSFVLTHLKNKLKEKFLVFTLDADFDEPVINILKKYYNIEKYPTLILEGNKLEGLQSKDDILDIQATQENLKKSTLSDFRLKRGNYPLVYTMEKCSKDQGESCLYALDNDQWDEVIKLIKKYKAIEYTMQLAQSYAEQAKEALQGFQFQNQELLEQLADFTVQREF